MSRKSWSSSGRQIRLSLLVDRLTTNLRYLHMCVCRKPNAISRSTSKSSEWNRAKAGDRISSCRGAGSVSQSLHEAARYAKRNLTGQ